MNLWARSIGRALFAAVALFFFSCEDESSFLGFKNPTPKFDVTYVEIPVTSSVLLVDSLRTVNFYSDNTPRLLVGSYSDEQFGEVKSTAFTQFYTTTASKLGAGASFDSVTIDLRFDFYTYGSEDLTNQRIAIHEVTEVLEPAKWRYFHNNTVTPYDPTPLGVKDFTVDVEAFDKYVADDKDTTITLHLPLSWDFGKRIFDLALTYRDATDSTDSVFVRYNEFVREFKGLAIVSNSGDKIVSFRPGATASRITLHYHDNQNDSLRLTLAFNGLLSYNHITSERGATDLGGLTSYHQDFLPPNNMRYVQSGTGIITKLDFGAFFDFVQADTNASLIVNEAELVIEEIDNTYGYDPPNSLHLYAMKENSRYWKHARPADANYQEDLRMLAAYDQYLAVTDTADRYFAPMGEGQIFQLELADDGDRYNGFMTRFVHQLSIKDEQKPLLRYFALVPSNPPFGKSVERLVFPENAVKLRVYYTRPTGMQP